MPVIRYRDIDSYPSRRQCQLFELARGGRRHEVATAEALAVTAERLGFPRLAGMALDLAIEVQESGMGLSWAEEIEAMLGQIRRADVAWKKACSAATMPKSSTSYWGHKTRLATVNPADFDLPSIDRAAPVDEDAVATDAIEARLG